VLLAVALVMLRVIFLPLVMLRVMLLVVPLVI
jgi:hypothetical protein